MEQIMAVQQDEIFASAARVRSDRKRLLSTLGSEGLQRRIVDAVANAAQFWLKTRESPERKEFEFAPSSVWYSLEPLLESLSVDNCSALIHQEGVRGVVGPEVIGHVIASNTPLLGIQSVVRALLVGSGSLVKLPDAHNNGWFKLFERQLFEAGPEISSLVRAHSWPRIEELSTKEFVADVDAVVVYGRGLTIRAIEALAKDKPVIGYGPRVSAGVVLEGSDFTAAAEGLATDVLLFDQGGCLSAHCIFVEGGRDECRRFAEALSMALRRSEIPYPFPTPERAAKIVEFRSLQLMDPDAEIVGHEGLRWTVVAHNQARMHVSPTHGNVYVVGIAKAGIIETINSVASIIQGVALSSDDAENWNEFGEKLLSAGASYVCYPGKLQQPTIFWREDNRKVLESFLS
jgi:acyl-CoA reductase-like NAD-dependent aldehyde dehydrogenase